jgi:NADH-quinone oxidoreductase subunit G
VFPWLGQGAGRSGKGQGGAAGRLQRADGATLWPDIACARRRWRVGKLMFVNPRDFEFRFPVAAKSHRRSRRHGGGAGRRGSEPWRSCKGAPLPDRLGRTRRPALRAKPSAPSPPTWSTSCAGHRAAGQSRTTAHPAFAQLRALAGFVARRRPARRFGYLPEAANSVGGWLAGAVPHRLPGGGKSCGTVGLDARAMLETPRKAYIVLVGVEPELDCWDGAAALHAMRKRGTRGRAQSLRQRHRQELRERRVLPTVATFAETSGTYVNAEGRWQSFPGASKPVRRGAAGLEGVAGTGQPLWSLSGFDYTGFRGGPRRSAKGACAQASSRIIRPRFGQGAERRIRAEGSVAGSGRA